MSLILCIYIYIHPQNKIICASKLDSLDIKVGARLPQRCFGFKRDLKLKSRLKSTGPKNQKLT